MSAIKQTVRVNAQPVTVHRWQDPADAARDFARHVASVRGSWYGEETGEDAVTFATVGNEALTGEADKVLDQIQASGLDTRGLERIPAPCGAYPVVAEFLAGRPDCMRRAAVVEDDRRPLRVYVNTTSSGSIDAKRLHVRGAALLAFVMTLAQERPIELWQVAALGGRHNAVVAVRVPTSPLNVGVACHVLTSQAWTRGLQYRYLDDELGTGGMWLFNIAPTLPAHNAAMRLALEAEPQDVVIPPIYMYDSLLKDPVAWINKELQRVRENHE